MTDFLLAADRSIYKFVTANLSPDYHPIWYDLVPGDKTKGWGASEPVWLNQMSVILNNFTTLTNLTLAFTKSEQRAFRKLPLSTLRLVMAQRAGATNMPAPQGGLFGPLP